MSQESIRMILETMCQYNTVNITQIFSKGEIDWIHVKCIPNTQTFELTYLQTETVQYIESIDEAVEVIRKSVYDSVAF